MLVNQYNEENPSEGLVYVQHAGIWGTVCSENFDDHDARVICKELGFHQSARAVPGASHVSKRASTTVPGKLSSNHLHNRSDL